VRDTRDLDTYPECRPDPTSKHYRDPEFWLDERIWGHRIYDQSTPHLILLETLNVAACLRDQGKIPFQDPPPGEEHNTHTSFRRSLVLRTILFNNPTLNARRKDADPWQKQFEDLFRIWSSYPRKGALNQYYGVDGADIEGPEAFAYLKKHFRRYDDYASFVDILRKGALEYESNKRWTSKFLFPYAPEALFEDLSDRTFGSDRRFFGRSGELAYLMLCRSGKGAEVWEGFRRALFDQARHAGRWRRGIRALMHPLERSWAVHETLEEGPVLGYLPYSEHPTFQVFGEDVVALLNAGMPEYDALLHVARIMAFHLAHYLLWVSAEGLDDSPSEPPVVKYTVEVHAQRPDRVRRLAKYSYRLNDELTSRRLDTALARIRDLNPPDLMEWWPRLAGSNQQRGQTDSYWTEFADKVKKRHKQHLGKVHHEYMRQCGFASRQGTNAYRYCPSDGFLRTLVLANVQRRMEFKAFLDRLYERYGIAVARRHVEQYSDGDLTDFDANAERLQARLARLGLVHRLSDACAYVVNRYKEEEE